MTRKPFTRAQLVKFTLTSTALFLLIFIAIGEIVLRIGHRPQPYSDKADLDDTLGWLPKANFESKYFIKNNGKDKFLYPVHYRTSENGFRTWGDINSSRPKVFFVGDSYTQAIEVSNENLFYNILRDSLQIEVFAFGQAGYGTLQQTMIIEKYIDEIDPLLVVWQSCDNDFIDNYAPLEYNSKYGTGLRRPYLTFSNEIIYRKAIPRWQEIMDKSKFLALLRKKWQTTFPSKKGPIAEIQIAEHKRDFPPFDQSANITSSILSRMKSAVGHRQLIGFSASPYQPQLSTMQNLADENGIPFSTATATQLRAFRNTGHIVHSQDGFHWNILGHKKVAAYLKEYIADALRTKTIVQE